MYAPIKRRAADATNEPQPNTHNINRRAYAMAIS